MRYELKIINRDAEKTFGISVNPEWNSQEVDDEDDVKLDDEVEAEDPPFISLPDWKEAEILIKHLNGDLRSEWQLGYDSGYEEGEKAYSEVLERRVGKIIVFAIVSSVIYLLL